MMRFAYGTQEPCPEAQEAAREIVELLARRGLTHKKASEALEVTQMLLEETKITVN